MEYNFKMFSSCGSGFRYDGIRIMKAYITLTRSTVEKLAGVKRVFIEYDEENKAVSIIPTEETTGYLIANKVGSSYAITCPIYRVMPNERYYFKEKIDNKLIFVAK